MSRLWPARRALSMASRKPRPNSALSSKSELDHAGTAAVGVRGVGRRRQVAAVDGGAPGGVRDERPVAVELGEELHVGRLAAAGAQAPEYSNRGCRNCEPLTSTRSRRLRSSSGRSRKKE